MVFSAASSVLHWGGRANGTISTRLLARVARDEKGLALAPKPRLTKKLVTQIVKTYVEDLQTDLKTGRSCRVDGLGHFRFDAKSEEVVFTPR